MTTEFNSNYLWGIGLLLVCLVGEGFLVDTQSLVKRRYQPSSNDLFTSTNKVAFVLSFFYSIYAGEMQSILRFIVEHKGFAWDLSLLCLCGTVGQLFVY